MFMKMAMPTATAVMPLCMTLPIDTVVNIMQMMLRMMMWPAMMLASSRMVSEKGLVNMPRISMTGINGMGHLSSRGTSGHRMSRQ